MNIYNYNLPRDSVKLRIWGNDVRGLNTQGTGINIYSGSNPLRAVIGNNEINNTYYGIVFSSEQSSRAKVLNNSIDSTQYYGIMLNRVSGKLEANTVTYAGRYSHFGVQLESDFNYPANDTLIGNTITENGQWAYSNPTPTTGAGGIHIVGYTQAVINQNNIYDNDGYEIVNEVASASVSQQDAKFNYWGTTTTAGNSNRRQPQELTKIYDQYDVSSLGFVNYGQNQPSFIFDEIPDTIYYGGDSVLIQTQNGKVGNWSNGVTNSDPIELNGYSGEIVFSYDFRQHVYRYLPSSEFDQDLCQSNGL